MTLQEIFTQNGIGEEIIAKLLAAMKENKIFTASEENLDVRYGKLKDEHATKLSELEQANGLIADFKKSEKGNEDLQTKITGYESQVTELQKQLEETKIKSAIKVALLSERAVDVDYLTFKLETKLKDEERTLQLDENGNIKGWGDMLSGLKVQFPTQFESSGSKKIDEHKLEGGNDTSGELTKGEILKKPYAERMKIFNENPEAYNAAMKS